MTIEFSDNNSLESPSDPEVVFQKETLIPQSTLEFFQGDELRARVFYEKYALRDENGFVIEKNPMDMWMRVAREIASAEPDESRKKEWQEKFYWLLEDFRFIPGGRILFGSGQTRNSTLLNCYFFPIKEDSLEAIFEFTKEAARTYSYGGGVGTDISILRPKGTPVNNSAIVSTGAVSFLELLSVTTGTIGQAGRRGALMVTMRVDHPDILNFINVKRDLSKVNHANISVMLTDEFMRAVEKNDDIELWFKNNRASVLNRIKARDIWNGLIKSSWKSAEPGVIFWDTVKRQSTTEYNSMEVRGFNPCSEQCLESYGCCCLGNVNLSEFILDEFLPSARIDWINLERAVCYAVRFLDDVLNYNADRHPLPQQKKASIWSRRIGVGFTGLADMLIKLRLKYDTENTIQLVDDLFNKIKNIAYSSSSNIAEEKGSFPGFDPEKHLKSNFIQRCDPFVLEKIKDKGLRNSCILTIPPVGSGSVLAGTTSGIEPIFALSYIRRSRSLSRNEFKVYHPLVQYYIERFKIVREEELPDFFVTAHSIKPEMRVKMQAAIQKHIDSSISSTVNLSSDAKIEDVGNIFFLAWRLGCKGITVYREGSREGILITSEQKPTNNQFVQFDRPRVLKGNTIQFKLVEGSLYVTINEDNEGIKEVFVNLGKSGEDEKAYAEAIGRLISLYLQQGGGISETIHTLKGIQGKNTVWSEGMQLLSAPDAVAKALEIFGGRNSQRKNHGNGLKCPECGECTVVAENGCYRCISCLYTKCG